MFLFVDLEYCLAVLGFLDMLGLILGFLAKFCVRWTYFHPKRCPGDAPEAVPAPPSSKAAKTMSDGIDEVEVEHVGKRTVPSRDIEEVDRSDRLGEDAELTDRVAANVATQDAPKEIKDVLIDEMMAERKAKRDEFSDAVEGLGDLLDD